MPTIRAYGAAHAGAPIGPLSIERREPGPHDVAIEILFCGICHSDLHQVRDEWGGATFPMVPGHEIVGRVTRVGSEVTRFSPGALVGVGCMVDACRTCGSCGEGLEQFCERGAAFTYNSTELDRSTPTHGGYSTAIVVDERFVLRVPEGLDPAGAAPLLCAGITTYSPLKQWGVGPGQRVAVVGLGGLGHMAVKLARSLGASVTVLSTSADKEADARRLGADDFAVTKDASTFERLARSFHLVLDTVSASHDYAPYLGLLRVRGAMVVVGVPPTPSAVHAFSLIGGNRCLAGSLIGGIAETQAMLDHCGAHGIVSDVEVIPIDRVDEAYERMVRSDVRYRFVIDLASLAAR
jgi:uncharacterized zinc-type alcohol dehydrogenase-like protein